MVFIRIFDEVNAFISKQGEKSPWRNNQNYFQDLFDIKFKKIDDGALVLRN